MATEKNPVYSVFFVSGDTKYDLTPAVENLTLNNSENQIAAGVTITLMNIKVDDTLLSNIMDPPNRIFIYADDGSRKDEVFRGFLWDKNRKHSVEDKTLQIVCFDNLIYFQESEEAEYFPAGQSTQSVFQSLCDKWGVQLNYTYESITHEKLVLRGFLSDIFTSSLLDIVKDRNGTKYVILSSQDILQVSPVASNENVYTIKNKINAVSVEERKSMDGIVTRIKILGKAGNDGRAPVEATVDGETDKYGTLQKLIDREENTALADAKKEAQNIIDEDGKPKTEYTIETVDIPWIRKGDKVQIDTDELKATVIVKGISHTISNQAKKMNLTCEDM